MLHIYLVNGGDEKPLEFKRKHHAMSSLNLLTKYYRVRSKCDIVDDLLLVTLFDCNV